MPRSGAEATPVGRPRARRPLPPRPGRPLPRARARPSRVPPPADPAAARSRESACERHAGTSSRPDRSPGTRAAARSCRSRRRRARHGSDTGRCRSRRERGCPPRSREHAPEGAPRRRPARCGAAGRSRRRARRPAPGTRPRVPRPAPRGLPRRRAPEPSCVRRRSGECGQHARPASRVPPHCAGTSRTTATSDAGESSCGSRSRLA